eukprot:5899350-Amphidinium_carterae.1
MSRSMRETHKNYTNTALNANEQWFYIRYVFGFLCNVLYASEILLNPFKSSVDAQGIAKASRCSQGFLISPSHSRGFKPNSPATFAALGYEMP